MDQQRLNNAAQGFTENDKGERFYFESPVPGLHIYNDVWPESMDFFNSLLKKEFWEENKDKPGYKKWVREDFFDDLEFTKENGKQADTCWVYSYPDANKAFAGPIDSYLYHWNLDPKSRESLRITRYSSGEFFGSHSDDTFATPRTVSLVYYPNDDYVGGELEFVHFGVTVKPKAKQLFVFPSAYSYEHKIHEIGEGNPRWTVVSFLFFGTDQETKIRRDGLEFPYKPKFESLFK
jgi:hypothetical protein